MDPLTRNEESPLIPRPRLFTGVRDRRLSHERQRAVHFILISTLFERFSFYAFANTLFTTLRTPNPFHWDDRHSRTASYIFSGLSYTSTLLFAIISDRKLGRAKTIIIGFILYLLGFTVISITASGNTFFCRFDETHHRNATSISEEKCAPTIIGTLIFTALGAGAIKSNLVVFGAEQIPDQELRQTLRYFDKYAVAINIGSMIATAVIPYVHNVVDYHHYYIVYLVAIVTLFIAAVLFLIGWRYYIHVNLNETIIVNCIPLTLNGCRNWCAYRTVRKQRKKEETELVRVNAPSHPAGIEESITIRSSLPSILDFARIPYGGRFRDRHVNDLKSLLSALVVFTLLVPFWLVYNQVGATFQSQAEHMRGGMPNYIASWMSLGDPVIVILGILVLNGIVYKRLTTRHRSLSITKKFVLGMCFTFASMCVAGTVEFFRHDQCNGDTGTSGLSVYAQLPQNILIGFSQLFGMVASYEYAYDAAPRSGQSLFMSLHFCSIGLSFLFGTIYFNVFPVPDWDIDFKCQKYDPWYWSSYTYFFNIAGLQLIFLIVFIVCCRKFQIVKINPQQLENSQVHR